MNNQLYLRIRKLRKQKGITQTHMAKKLGYKSVSPYNAFESGRKKRGITVEQARIIANELGVTMEELFFENNFRESRKDEDEEHHGSAHTA